MNLMNLKEYQFTVLGVPYFHLHVNKLFLCLEKQRPDYLKGKILGPGGKIEKNETPEQAMVRELKEETNLTITEDNLNLIGHICYEETKTFVFLYSINVPLEECGFIKQMTDEKLFIGSNHYKYYDEQFSETTKIILKRIFPSH